MAKKSLLYKIGKVIVPPIYKLIYFYKIKNKNCLPDTGRYIVCANHLSYKDPLLVALSQKRQIYFMAKEELFRFKSLNKIITAAGAFAVKRGVGSESALKYAEDLLNDGELVGVFLEGTRSKNGEPLSPKSGAALLAYQTKTPVLPISLSTKGGGKLKAFHRITINCGKPLSLEDMGMISGDRKEFRKASRVIMDNIKALRNEDI